MSDEVLDEEGRPPLSCRAMPISKSAPPKPGPTRTLRSFTVVPRLPEALERLREIAKNLWWAWDYYTRSKVECERLLWRMADEKGLPLTVIRPSWLYGERDRTTTARLVGRLRDRKVLLVGRGDNPLSAVYVAGVVLAILGNLADVP